jgi:hypothetical protein
MPTPLLSDGSGKLDIEMLRGVTFQKIMTYTNNGSAINITGYTFEGNVYQNDATTVLATFTITLHDAVNGKFKVYMSPVTTATIPVGSWYYYITTTTPGGDVFLIFKGAVQARNS